MTTRRQFLRGAATTLLLPAFPSLGHAAEIRPRYIQFFAPNGAVMGQWTPADQDVLVLSPALQPLDALRDSVSVLSNIALPAMQDSHTAGMRSLLTEQLEDRFGTSLDQRLAPVVSAPCPVRAIQLTCQEGVTCGSFECGWLRTSSWVSAEQPAPVFSTPAEAMSFLFGATPSPATTPEQRRRSTSLLDAVLEDANQLSGSLSGGDRHYLDRYLTGVRELERRLQTTAPAGCPPAELVAADSLVEHVDVMLEVARLALECDATRVINLMLGPAESYRPLDFLGHTGNHHSASHFDEPAHADATRWMVSRYASFLASLRDSVQPSDRTLLDDSFVLYVSEHGDGPSHDMSHVPVILGGRGGGSFSGGKHLRFAPSTPMAGLAASLLDHYGAPRSGFTDNSLLSLS